MIDSISKKLRAENIKNFEVYVQQPRSNNLYLRRNQLELSQQKENPGFSIRIHENGIGFSQSNFFNDAAVKEAIENTLLMSKASQKMDFTFPEDKKTKNVKNIDKKLLFEESEQSLKDYQTQMVDLIRKRGCEVCFAKLKAFDMKTSIVNSQGLAKEKQETLFFLELSIKSSKSEFWTMRYARRLADLPIKGIEEWVDLAKRADHAVEPKNEKTTVILSPSVMVDLATEVFSFHSTGSNVKKKINNWLPEKKIASKEVSIVDDGLYPYGLQTSPFDDEGNPQQQVELVKNGVFKNFLYDQMYAKQFNADPTGNAIRQRNTLFSVDDRYAMRPVEQTTNLHFLPGKKSFDKLLEETKKGIIIYKFSWLNPNEQSGNFASEIRNAAYIENGEIATPIKGGIISGNVFDLLQNVSGISNKCEIVSGSTSFSGVMPFVRFDNVQVAGS